MNLVTEWVQNVFLMMLAISFLEMLLPSGTMRNYLKFIFSLLLLTVMLYPLQFIGEKEIVVFHSIPYSFSTSENVETDYELSQVQTKQISEVYKEKISATIKEKLENKFSGISEAVVEIYINENRSSKCFGELEQVILFVNDSIDKEALRDYLANFLHLPKRNILIQAKEETNEITHEK